MRWPSQAKWLSPSRMRKVSPALLVISGRRWKGKSRFFDRKLEPDIWGDFEANLLASVQWLPLFKQEKLMVKLIGMMECSSASDQRCGLLVNWMKWVMTRRSLQMFSSAWKPGSRSQWTRYRRVVHCLLDISRVKCFEGKAITQNLEIIYEWIVHQKFVQLSFCLS